MTIQLKKFGKLLTSRPAGREAWLAAQAYSLPNSADPVVVDFTGVAVLGPSWADEFLSELVKLKGQDKVSFVNTDNESVLATLKILKLNF